VVAFLTTVELTGRTATFLRVPVDVPALFDGRHRPPVLVKLCGHTYRSTVAKYGDEYFLPLSRENREAAGVAAGDRVAVQIEPDTAPREIDPPPELAVALAGDQEARAVFGSLSYSHRKEYADWVAEAKRPETRRRRAAKAVELLREGRTARG
jgi:Bacteriocin-protection, YdeI or OmpD-Associated/Domain of unknown function (DUF1905)